MIDSFADWLVFELLEFREHTPLGNAVHFFVYDTSKILLLILLISFVMGVVNAYLPVERIQQFLARHNRWGVPHLVAAVFGAITPFCSCSSIPLFIGFLRGGIPLSVTLSFLITSPLVNEIAVASFLGVFGWKVTVIYAGSGILLGLVGGLLLERFKLEKHLTPWAQEQIHQSTQGSSARAHRSMKLSQRLVVVFHEAMGIVKQVVPYVIVGIAIGAAVHGYVPASFFSNLLREDAWYNVPLAVVCGVPMYTNAAALVPVVQVLVEKGVPLGTALAFMMATVGLSLPEAILLRKVMTPRLIGIFFLTVTCCIIVLGYAFDWLF